MAYSERPNEVMRSTTPVTMARIRNTATESDSQEIPRNPLTPTFVYLAGKLETVVGPSTTLASPLYNVRVPMVTASDGSPALVTSSPLMRPATHPIANTTTKITGIAQ